jgi:hypothetical protein
VSAMRQTILAQRRLEQSWHQEEHHPRTLLPYHYFDEQYRGRGVTGEAVVGSDARARILAILTSTLDIFDEDKADDKTPPPHI